MPITFSSCAPPLLLSDLNSNGLVIELDGENVDDASGFAVSVAGDVNNDGYSDVIIGARGYGSTKGRSYVVFGGPTASFTSPISLSTLKWQ